MADPKRTQGTPEKGRQTGQKRPERQDEQRRVERNPEPHKDRGESGKKPRGV